MKFKKVFFSLIVAIVFAFNMSVYAFATEATFNGNNAIKTEEAETIIYQDEDLTIVKSKASENNNDGIAIANTVDYASTWLNSSDAGSFNITTSNSGTVGVTLKVESSSNNSFAYISVIKPNGDAFKNNIYVDPTSGNGEGEVLKMYFASSGTYKINYIAYTTVGMRIMCWMY